MGDEKIVEESVAMEDRETRVCNPRGDVFVRESGQNVEEPLEQQKEEDSRRDEKLKKVVEEIGVGEDEDEPIGDVLRVSEVNHFAAFVYDGVQYKVEDSVMFNSEGENNKPYVGIIRDIFRKVDGKMMVKVQWFYRPENIEIKGGKFLECTDARMLFYSFHLDDLPAETVMHKCIVHFVPLDKQIPYRKKHPGFIVQKVYDPLQKKLFKFTDKVFVRNKKEEINVLIQKTISRIGGLSDKDSKVQPKKKKKY